MNELKIPANLDSAVFEAFTKAVDRQFIYICDVETNIWRWSPHSVEHFGLPSEYIVDLPTLWMERVHPDDRESVAKAFGDMFSGVALEHSCEYRVKNAQSQYIWVLCRGCMVDDKGQGQKLCAGILTDLGQKNKFDQITGLYSSHELLKAIGEIKNHPEASGGILALDIDHFRSINEMYRRSFGNTLLQAFARKLHHIMPGSGILYRMGDDRFALIYPGATQELLSKVFDNINRVCAAGLDVKGKRIVFSVSGGAIFYPENGTSEEDVYSNLEYAYETSKKYNRGGLTFFTDNLRDEARRKQQLQQLLHESVKNECKDFRVYYQPIVSSDASHELVGAEALLRWSHPDFPGVSPVDIIPLLEESGDIQTVGRWVLSTALQQVKKWQERKPEMKISVNVSFLQFLDKNFKHFVLEELERNDFQHSKLTLELTESCDILQPAEIQSELSFFRKNGIQIALDDFGTGYASLSVLRDLTADWIKVDRTFVSNIVESSFDQALTQSLIGLCKQLNLNICVEGIETRAIEEVIEGYCPTVLQGYYYSKPIPADIFELKYIIGVPQALEQVK